MKLNIFSDLRKPGLVPGKSLSLAQNYVFCFGETSIYIMSNRMKNLHKQLLKLTFCQKHNMPWYIVNSSRDSVVLLEVKHNIVCMGYISANIVYNNLLMEYNSLTAQLIIRKNIFLLIVHT